MNIHTLSLMNIPRLYTAIAQCLSCSIFWFLLSGKKRKLNRFLGISVLAFAADSLWLIFTDHVPLVFWILCMLVSFAIMGIYLYGILRPAFLDNVYLTLKCIVIAEFMASLEWQLEYFFRVYLGIGGVISYIMIPAVYGLIAFLIYRIERGMQKDFRGGMSSIKNISVPVLIVIISFSASNISFIEAKTPFSAQIESDIFYLRTIIDLAGLAVFYAWQSYYIETEVEKELSAISSMLKAQYEHYRSYQDTIDLINMKYHDLKHQLAGLRLETDQSKREQWIDALSSDLERYKPETQTGNQVLDGILDQKMGIIRKNGIHFTYVADGKTLEFMHVIDICTIFGNALDNAIESLIMVADEEKRILHLSVSQKRQFVCIEISNYCDHVVKMSDGYPRTTKRDKKNHGFGVKSIAFTADKYGGSTYFGNEGDLFITRVLIPR